VRLNETDAQISAQGEQVRDHIEMLLGGMGFNDPHTMYDGFSSFRCGGGSWPTGVTTDPIQLRGHVAALYLRAAYDVLDANDRCSTPLDGRGG
jgi:hypothetical protein